MKDSIHGISWCFAEFVLPPCKFYENAWLMDHFLPSEAGYSVSSYESWLEIRSG